mgnify:CR=1 FL=1
MTEEPMRLARISLWCLASLNVLRGIELLVTMALTHAAWQASASASADLSDQMTLTSLMLSPLALMAFGVLGVCLVQTVGLVTMATQNKLVPYVVQVDKLGSVVPVARADQMNKTDERVVCLGIDGDAAAT